MTRRPSLRLVALLLLLSATTARADPPPEPLPPLTYRAALHERVRLTLRDGRTLVGDLTEEQPDTIDLDLEGEGDTYSLDKSAIAQIALDDSHRPSRTSLAVSLDGVGVGVSFEHRWFFAFASGSLLVPALSGGSFTAIASGAGLSIPFPRSRWRWDLFAHVVVGTERAFFSTETETVFALGVGLGFHYEARNHLTVGFEVPFFGFDLLAQSNNGFGSPFGNYYLFSAASLPLFTFGYRFTL